MYLFATGEPPFREWSFDKCLAMRVCEGLRPSMPESAPEEYKKLAEWCCDADPDKRPKDGETLFCDIDCIGAEYDPPDNAWSAVYHNDVKPLSRLEKESKYSSKLLPTGDSAAGMKTIIGYE